MTEPAFLLPSANVIQTLQNWCPGATVAEARGEGARAIAP